MIAAAAAAADDELEFDQTVIVGTTPVPGIGQPLDRVPANVQLLDDHQIERLAPIDPTSLLERRVGGVHLAHTQNNPLQADLTYRGFTASPLLGVPQGISVFQDGVRLNEFLGDTVNWDLIPMDAVASLQLAPGSDPVYGRNTLGSAVAIQTRRGRTHPGSGAEVYWGSFDRRRAMARVGGTHGDFDYYLAGNLFRESGFRDFSKNEQNQLFAQLGWAGAETDLSLTYTAARNDLRGLGFAPESLLEADRSAVFTHPDIVEPELHFLHLTASRSLGIGLRLDGSVHFRSLRISQLNTDEREAEEGGDDSEELGGVARRSRIEQRRVGGLAQITDSRFHAGIENTLSAGVDFDFGSGDLRLVEEDGVLNERRSVTLSGERRLATDVETDGDAVGVFVTDTLTPRPWVSLTASARYDRNHIRIDDRFEGDASGRHTFDRLNPSVGVTLRPRRFAHFFARYGESFRSPTAIELTCASESDPCPLPIAFAEDPPLDEVRVQTVEAGIRTRPFRDVRATAAYFRTELHDDILFVTTGRAEGFFRNVDRTRRQGAELSLEGTTRGIEWFASYAYTLATFETAVTLPAPEPGNTARPGDQIPGVPNHIARLGFETPLPWDLRLGFDVGYTGEQFLRTDEANRFPRLDDYVVANARLGYTRGRFTIFARAENLFDAEYESFGTRAPNVFADDRVERFLSPGAPLGGWIGVRLDL